MKDHSSSKLSKRRSMEVERSKLKEEPYISGAHIRSLVKQLSSSRPREIVGDHSHPQNSGNFPAEDSTSPQPKKQARRRLNTSRPYQERLLNMAEARREIVTALKFHRAAMKKASEQQQQQKEKLYQPQSPPSQNLTPILEDSHFGLLMDTHKPNPIALNYTQQSSYLSPFSYSSSPYWTYPQFTPLPISDNLINFPLPNQPLGLNLNLQGFNNVETPCNNNNNNNNNKSPILQQPTSSSTSISSSSSSTADMANLKPADPTLHRVMRDEEMEEIRSICDKHDMEWNDMMNSVTTAWWSKFLKAMEPDDGGENRSEGDAFQMFSEVMEIPAWLSGESGMDNCSGNFLFENQMDDQLENVTLPCLDIGEIEELDADWFAW